MIEALARSIAETTADVLGRRAAGGRISDEAIGQHLWFDRGFRSHTDLVALINFVREMLDRRDYQALEAGQRSPPSRKRLPNSSPDPRQLWLDLEIA